MSRCSLIPSLIGLALLPLVGLADGLPLRAFEARYNLYQGGLHVADAQLSLSRDGDDWRWRMTTQARSVYAWFVKRRPHNETRFSVSEDGFRLLEISLTDESRPGRDETARFDWGLGELKVKRKRKKRRIPLDTDVYDYQSIHLLCASMARDGVLQREFDFYRKGKLIDSTIRYAGDGQVEVRGKPRQARIYEQRTARSKSTLRYYYDIDNPLLPLRIERSEKGEPSSRLQLQRVEWKL